MDYLSFFNLRSEPFSHAPLSRLYYASSQHTRALRRLLYAVSNMRGLALLVGDIGRGKTTLARRLLDMLPEEEYEAAMLVIVHTGITPTWLLKRLALQLGVPDPADDKLDILSQLYQRLIEIHRSGRRAVVLIDEAQMLASRELMEEFRGLLNLEVPGKKLITFVFFGLPEIEQNLQLDPPLAQRVALRCCLEPLGLDDTTAYVRHRMRLCGGSPDVFSDAALKVISESTGGIPRVINTLCDNTLLELYFSKSNRAEAELVREVADGLGLGLGLGSPVVAGASREVVGATTAEAEAEASREVGATAAEVEAEAELFGALGWLSPDDIAQRVADEPTLAESWAEIAVAPSSSAPETVPASAVFDVRAIGAAAAAAPQLSSPRLRLERAKGSPVGHGDAASTSRLVGEVQGPLAALFRDAMEAMYGLAATATPPRPGANVANGANGAPVGSNVAPSSKAAPAGGSAGSGGVVAAVNHLEDDDKPCAASGSGTTIDLGAVDSLLADVS